MNDESIFQPGNLMFSCVFRPVVSFIIFMFTLLRLPSHIQRLMPNADAAMMDLTGSGSGSDQVDIQSDDSQKIDAFTSSSSDALEVRNSRSR